MNIHELRRLTRGTDPNGHMFQRQIEETMGDLSMRGLHDITEEEHLSTDGIRMIAFETVHNIFIDDELKRYGYCEGDDPRDPFNHNAKIALLENTVTAEVVPVRHLSRRTNKSEFRFISQESMDELTVSMHYGAETIRVWKFVCHPHAVLNCENEALVYRHYVEDGYHWLNSADSHVIVPDGTNEAEIDADYEILRANLNQIQPYHWSHHQPYLVKPMYAEGEEDCGQPLYGVEVETCNDRSQEQINTVDFTDGWWHVENDSSINGFECISRPLSYKAWVEKYTKVFAMFQKMIASGIRSHDSGEHYGLHVHISRRAFKNDVALYGFIGMFHEFKNPLQKLARREDSRYAKWYDNEFDRWTDSYVKIKDHISRVSNDRYMCVNLTNQNTIEVRIFKGTLNATTFMTILEILNKMVIKANELTLESTENIEWKSFLGGNFEVGTREGYAKYPLELDSVNPVFNCREFFLDPRLLDFRRRKETILGMIEAINNEEYAETEGRIIVLHEDEVSGGTR